MTRPYAPRPPIPPTRIVLPPHDAAERMEVGRVAANPAIAETSCTGDPAPVEDLLASTLDSCPWWSSGVITTMAQHVAALARRNQLHVLQGGLHG